MSSAGSFHTAASASPEPEQGAPTAARPAVAEPAAPEPAANDPVRVEQWLSDNVPSPVRTGTKRPRSPGSDSCTSLRPATAHLNELCQKRGLAPTWDVYPMLGGFGCTLSVGDLQVNGVDAFSNKKAAKNAAAARALAVLRAEPEPAAPLASLEAQAEPDGWVNWVGKLQELGMALQSFAVRYEFEGGLQGPFAATVVFVGYYGGGEGACSVRGREEPTKKAAKAAVAKVAFEALVAEFKGKDTPFPGLDRLQDIFDRRAPAHQPRRDAAHSPGMTPSALGPAPAGAAAAAVAQPPAAQSHAARLLSLATALSLGPPKYDLVRVDGREPPLWTARLCFPNNVFFGALPFGAGDQVACSSEGLASKALAKDEVARMAHGALEAELQRRERMMGPADDGGVPIRA